MTNHMAEVAQMLGVELEEVFKVTDDDSGKYHNYYKFTEKKGIEVSEDNVKWEADTAGTLVLKWLLIGVYQNYYRFSENNCFETSYDGVEWGTATVIVLRGILIGVARIIKLPWKPQKCAPYYIPCIVAQSEHMYSMFYWNDDNYDKEYYRMGLVRKTPEEAVALTKKMLEAINEQ